MKKVYYSSPYVPPELIAACGFEPVRYVPGTAHGRSGPIRSEPIGSGPIGAGEGICPFMCRFVDGSCAVADAVVLVSSCDQMRRAGDIIRCNSDVPVFLLNMPSTWQTTQSAGLYLAELKRLIKFLERLGGTVPCSDRLCEVMAGYEKLRREQDCQSSTSDTGEVRLAVTGGPLARVDYKLMDLLGKLGGSIVLDGTEYGERSRPALFDRRLMDGAPIEALAKAYFSIPDIFRRPNSMYYAWLMDELKLSRVQGIVLFRYIWCDLWHAEVQRMKDCLGLPLLDIDLNGEDPLARASTRIEAFMEGMMQVTMDGRNE